MGMTICGKPQAAQGTVRFAGEDITHLATDTIIRRGISHAPEGRRIFPRMTVLENLQMGAIVADRRYFAEDLERVLSLFPILKSRQEQRGGKVEREMRSVHDLASVSGQRTIQCDACHAADLAGGVEDARCDAGLATANAAQHRRCHGRNNESNPTSQ